jgi:hypothetical protein
MSKIILHIRGEKMFFLCAKMEEREVPDHSNNPMSLDTPKVISVGSVGTLMAFRNAMKLAIRCQSQILAQHKK